VRNDEERGAHVGGPKSIQPQMTQIGPQMTQITETIASDREQYHRTGRARRSRA
jgi:hypothetical protein